MRPPFWLEGAPCPNWCARDYYDRTVHNHQSLHGEWQGWRIAGRWLINPSDERIAPHLLDRWMYRHGVMFRWRQIFRGHFVWRNRPTGATNDEYCCYGPQRPHAARTWRSSWDR